MFCLVTFLAIALAAVALAAHWLFNPPTWWPPFVRTAPADRARVD